LSVPATTTKRALVPKWTKPQLELLKRTVAKGTTDDEFSLFLYSCKRTGLDPFIKQIYAIKRWDSQTNSFAMAIQTGIDGYRLIASRTGDLAGIDEPEFVTDANTPDHPVMATVTVYRFVQGERCKFVGQARWAEYVQKDKDGNACGRWRDMGFNQLAKCAEAAALRKAFPQDLSGIYTNEEMPVIDIESVQDVPEKAASPAEQPKADDYVTGVFAAYTPGDAKAKKAHRFTFKTDAGAEVTLTAFERPETLRKEGAIKEALGHRCQFKFEEKPNAKNPNNPYRNLTHFALEVVEDETADQSTPPDKNPAEQPAEQGQPSDNDKLSAYLMLLDSADSKDMLQDLWNTIAKEIKTELQETDQKKVSNHFFARKKEMEKS